MLVVCFVPASPSSIRACNFDRLQSTRLRDSIDRYRRNIKTALLLRPAFPKIAFIDAISATLIVRGPRMEVESIAKPENHKRTFIRLEGSTWLGKRLSVCGESIVAR